MKKKEEHDFKLYVGAKLIKAKPMSRWQFNAAMHCTSEGKKDQLGYMVEYPDGYTSWSPKNVFEEAYRLISLGEMELVTSEIEHGNE